MFRSDFPIFQTHPGLVYLDSASSAQKPRAVIDAMTQFLTTSYANIHRGAYDLSMETSLLYERAKEKIAEHLNVESYHEIAFTYNATYAFNLIARSLVKTGILQKGDIALLSKAEHHANIVPWQIIAEEHGITVEWVDLHSDGTIDYKDLEKKLPRAKVVSLTGASNVTGELLDLERVKKIFDRCYPPLKRGAGGFVLSTQNPPALRASSPSVSLPSVADLPREVIKPLFILDGSQRFPHMETDVQQYGIDIFVGTGHKIMSDTGIGFFYARRELLKQLVPAFCGGGAINFVHEDGYEPAGLPFRHEPGTPHIAGAISLLAALEYIQSIGGFETIETYEGELVEYMLKKCEEAGFFSLPDKAFGSEAQARRGGRGVFLIGSKDSKNRLGVFSFAFDTLHPNDVAEMLADANICVRSGHHCTEPLHDFLGIGGSLRMSLYLYNTKEDIDRFFETLLKVAK